MALHLRVRVGSVCKGAAWVVFPPPSGRDLDWAVLRRTRLAVLLRWGTETPERVPATWIYTRRPLIGRQNRHFRATGDNNQQTQYPRGVSGRRKLCLLKKMTRKCLPPFLVVLHCCSLFIVHSFFLGFISRLHGVGLLWGHDAYVAATAIVLQLKPCLTIRALAAVETRAVTELG